MDTPENELMADFHDVSTGTPIFAKNIMTKL